MRKLLSLVLLLLALCANGRQITADEAAAVASDFMNSPSVKMTEKCTGVTRVKACGELTESATVPYYVFNADDNGGFVIVSGDDRVSRILGYSDKGSFDFTSLPPQLASMLEGYAEKLTRLPAGQTTHRSWSKSFAVGEGNEVVLPTATWGQWYPFNMYAQEIDGTKCPSGCVATAMAIVMKYNNWPAKGRGKNKWNSNGTVLDYSFDDLQLDFTLMPDKFEEGKFTDQQAREVGKLMQAAGAAVNMAYTLDGSGAMTCVAPHYLHEYFRYSPKSQFISPDNFNKDEWIGMIREQIDANHPIIMNGRSAELGGHAFVCDGYNVDDLVHINWGWDGVSNGFFDAFLLDGFDMGIGMGINLYNDGNEKEFARCWNDNGYLWANVGQGAGFNISVENVRKDTSFAALVGVITFPNDFNGEVSIALVDEDENIVEVNERGIHQITENHDMDKLGYTWFSHGPLSFADVMFTGDIRPEMRMQAVARETGEDDWKLVPGTIEAPSSKPVTGNTPYMSTVTSVLHDPYNLTEMYFPKDKVLLGDIISMNLKATGGVTYMLLDGIYRGNGSDFTSCDYSFVTLKESYRIEIFANPYDKLLERTVKLDQAGTLSEKISKEDAPLIYSLAVEGPMNYLDYEFITRNMCSIKHLDVSKTTVTESAVNRRNYLPITAGNYLPYPEDDAAGFCTWTLESIVLPSGLEGFENYSLPNSGVIFVEMPGSVVSYGAGCLETQAGTKLDFLKVNNPEPVNLVEDTGALDNHWDCIYRCNTILYVPVGSKQAYENSPVWRGFKEIRESDDEFVGKFIDVDGARYLIMSDFALISGVYKSDTGSGCFVIPETVEYNGRAYTVKGNTRDLAAQPFIISAPEFDFHRMSGEVVTTCINGKYTCGKDEIQLYVPGGCKDNYKELPITVTEMWSYEIDKKKNAVRIIPMYWGAEINRVYINGKEAAPAGENVYVYADNQVEANAQSVDTADGLDISVEYTLHETLPASVHYDKSFNESQPSVEIETSGIDEVALDAEAPVDVYTPGGVMLVKGCEKSRLQNMAPGVYLLRQGEKTFKVVIR